MFKLFTLFKHFFKFSSSNSQQLALQLYKEAVAQGRTPYFYQTLEVPDTAKGRFEILTLHLFLVLRWLKSTQSLQNQMLQQEICNLFVEDLDLSLREMPVSDKKMAKNYKNFIQGFYGRLIAYDEAYEKGKSALKEVIERNIFEGKVANDTSGFFSTYIQNQLEHLKTQDKMSFLKVG